MSHEGNSPEKLSPSEIAFGKKNDPVGEGYVDYYDGERRSTEDVIEVTVDDQGEPAAPPAAKKKGSKGLLFLLVVLVAGGAAYAFLPADLLNQAVPSTSPSPQVKQGLALEIESVPSADIYMGDTKVGVTPMVVTQQDGVQEVVLRRDGFRDEVVSFSEADPSKTVKVFREMEAAGVALDWTGLPEGARVLWNDEEIDPKEFLQAPAGEARVQVVTLQGPPVSLTVDVTPAAAPIKLGSMIEERRARHPKLKVTLKLPESLESVELPLLIRQVSQDEDGYRAEQTLSGGDSSLSLPGPGTYDLIFAGTSKLQAFTKRVILTEQAGVELVLEPTLLDGAKPSPTASPVVAETPEPARSPQASPTPGASPEVAVTPSPKVSPAPAGPKPEVATPPKPAPRPPATRPRPAYRPPPRPPSRPARPAPRPADSGARIQPPEF